MLLRWQDNPALLRDRAPCPCGRCVRSRPEGRLRALVCRLLPEPQPLPEPLPESKRQRHES